MDLAGVLDLLRHQHRGDGAPNRLTLRLLRQHGQPPLAKSPVRCTKLLPAVAENGRGIAAECWRFLDGDAGRTFPAVYTKSFGGVHTTGSPMNILLTGFGPFPGAPVNPTQRLVEKLARSRASRPQACAASRTYSAPATRRSIANCRNCSSAQKPDVLVMFGLAARTRHLRIETRARNAREPHRSGCRRTRRRGPVRIVPGAAASLALRVPAQRLLKAARSTGVKAALSRDAGQLPLQLSVLARHRGRRATRRAEACGLHPCAAGPAGQAVARHAPLTFDQLVRAGEAIVLRRDRRRAHRPLTALR